MKFNFRTRGRSWMAAIGLLLASATVSLAASQTYYYYVFSGPTDSSVEDRYNTWYNVQHAPDVVAVPDFVSAQRFVINDEQLNDAALKLPKYVVVYKIVTENLAVVNKEVGRRRSSNETILDSSFKGGVSYTYKNIAPEVKGAGETSGAKAGQDLTYLQFIFSQPMEGKEDEFNAWYDKTYIPALAGAHGVVAAQRMIIERPTTRGVPSTKYLSTLTIQTADISAVLKSEAKKYSQSNAAVDPANTRAYTYRAVGPIILGDDVRAYRHEAKASRP